MAPPGFELGPIFSVILSYFLHLGYCPKPLYLTPICPQSLTLSIDRQIYTHVRMSSHILPYCRRYNMTRTWSEILVHRPALLAEPVLPSFSKGLPSPPCGILCLARLISPGLPRGFLNLEEVVTVSRSHKTSTGH